MISAPLQEPDSKWEQIDKCPVLPCIAATACRDRAIAQLEMRTTCVFTPPSEHLQHGQWTYIAAARAISRLCYSLGNLYGNG